MVWQVNCLCGFKTQPFFMNGNMNSKVYVKECLKKWLSAMNHPSSDLILHLAITQEAQSNGINKMALIVPENMNPANVPQLHPIEKF